MFSNSEVSFPFSLIYASKPENLFFQYVGLISWIHFIIYSILGSIMPEAKPNSVNLSTYVFDDVPNEHALWFILGAIFTFFTMNQYYIPMIERLVLW